MDISEIVAISELGMKYESKRMQVASTNIAFANQMSSSPSTVYRRLTLSSSESSKVAFSMDDFDGSVEQLKKQLTVHITSELKVKPVHLPASALADSAGYVYKPDISMVTEMLTLTTATRAYEANIRAFNTYGEMSKKALEIGRR